MKLIKTIEEVRKFVPVLSTAAIDNVSPYLSNAERNYILLVIGPAQFNALVEEYNSASGDTELIMDPVIRHAVEIAQKVIANLGYYTAIPILNVNVGDSGITVFSNSDTKQAFQWQVDEIKASFLELGFSAIEELLIHLEQSPDIFHYYMDSEQFMRNERFLIREAAVFSDNFNIGGSRYVFQMLAALMKRVEDQTVKRLYGAEFFENLKKDEPAGKIKVLVQDYIIPGIALLTGAKALVERTITFKNGIASINLEGNFSAEKNNTPATRDQVTAMAAQLMNDGNQFLQDGLEYLVHNVQEFPAYVKQIPKRRFTVKSDKDKGVFVP
ncbi:DUF6712 family protein [Pedobacter antarcticus]|uniref:DUF6712 family protein n=1 Tax=Pedobacter antarcticus TaxID=34086 RepID=UPI0008808BE1|nr:DUF6712 family protein [Pedobacter antarcticus]SDM40692.1 hypothetical protein SAMN04488084_106174 [Pedobacter antarcticus]